MTKAIPVKVRRIPHILRDATPIADVKKTQEICYRRTGVMPKTVRVSAETLKAYSLTDEWQNRLNNVAALFGKLYSDKLEVQWENMTNTTLIIDNDFRLDFGQMGLE